ncbi:MAG: regulatory protein TetR [Fibrobacteres bacterium]|nr:regulatory protein TetR [Fibrobacterota bacterium]
MGRPKNFNREEVLEKAMPLFWKRGFADTGLQDLEKATGVNKSGLYSEFKNKEDLYLATLRHYGETRKARGLLSEAPLGWKNIENFLTLKMTGKGEMKGCFAVNSMREIALLPPEAQEIMAENRSSLKGLFLKNITAEKTRLAPEALVEILSTFFSGLCIEQNLKAGKPSPLRKVEDFMKLLRQM